MVEENIFFNSAKLLEICNILEELFFSIPQFIYPPLPPSKKIIVINKSNLHVFVIQNYRPLVTIKTKRTKTNSKTTKTVVLLCSTIKAKDTIVLIPYICLNEGEIYLERNLMTKTEQNKRN
jgi:hypothetical protein